MTEPDLGGFLLKHRLPESYSDLAQRWFFGLANDIALRRHRSGQTIILGINGSQGSGKSTLADLLHYLFTKHYTLNTVVLSIDDFYYTYREREQLAKTVHPLMATRGVPGTHDVDLIVRVISALKQGNLPVRIPRFDKAADDREPESQWDTIIDKPEIIIFEGWCIGAEPQPESELMQPVNELESSEDPDASWRRHVNEALGSEYQGLFAMIDTWVMLKAPSFDCVYQWRLEQEQKLRQKQHAANADPGNSKIMSDREVSRFIQYYQRITENLLKTLPSRVDYLYELDAQRNIIAFHHSNR